MLMKDLFVSIGKKKDPSSRSSQTPLSIQDDREDEVGLVIIPIYDIKNK